MFDYQSYPYACCKGLLLFILKDGYFKNNGANHQLWISCHVKIKPLDCISLTREMRLVSVILMST